MRWEYPDKLHVTIAFLGDLTAQQVDEVKELLRTAVRGYRPFTLAVRGVGAFPDENNPSVIWAGIAEAGTPLLEMQQKIEDELAGAGYRQDRRPFTAHITLGRPDRDGLANTDWATITRAGDIDWGTVEVAAVHILESRSGRYYKLSEIPLN